MNLDIRWEVSERRFAACEGSDSELDAGVAVTGRIGDDVASGLLGLRESSSRCRIVLENCLFQTILCLISFPVLLLFT